MSLRSVNEVQTTRAIQSKETKNKEIYNDNKADKKLSDSAKYMIGATALAGVIAVGIIGHRNNWWRHVDKAVKNVDDAKIHPNRNSASEVPTSTKQSEKSVPDTTEVNSKSETSQDLNISDVQKQDKDADVSKGLNDVHVAPSSLENNGKMNFDYKRTEFRDSLGYYLECETSGRSFARYEGFKDYTHKLDNDCVLWFRQGTDSGTINGTDNVTGKFFTTKIFNADNVPVYQHVNDGIANCVNENIADRNDMFYYTAFIYPDGSSTIYRQKLIGDLDKPLLRSAKRETVSREEFDRLRQEVLDKLLPKGYERLKAKHLNSIPHILKDDTKEFFRSGSKKALKRDIGNGWFTYTGKDPENKKTVFSLSIGGGEPVYSKIDNESSIIELINLPDGRLIKHLDKNTGELTYNCSGKNISEQQFNEIRDMIMKNVGKKFGKKSFSSKYDISFDYKTGRICEFTKYDDYGNIIERVITDFDDENQLMIIPYKNGEPVKEGRRTVPYNDFDFSDLIADRKKFRFEDIEPKQQTIGG